MAKKIKAALYTGLITVLLFLLCRMIYAYPIIATILLVGGGCIFFIACVYNVIYMNLKD